MKTFEDIKVGDTIYYYDIENQGIVGKKVAQILDDDMGHAKYICFENNPSVIELIIMTKDLSLSRIHDSFNEENSWSVSL